MHTLAMANSAFSTNQNNNNNTHDNDNKLSRNEPPVLTDVHENVTYSRLVSQTALRLIEDKMPLDDNKKKRKKNKRQQESASSSVFSTAGYSADTSCLFYQSELENENNNSDDWAVLFCNAINKQMIMPNQAQDSNEDVKGGELNTSTKRKRREYIHVYSRYQKRRRSSKKKSKTTKQQQQPQLLQGLAANNCIDNVDNGCLYFFGHNQRVTKLPRQVTTDDKKPLSVREMNGVPEYIVVSNPFDTISHVSSPYFGEDQYDELSNVSSVHKDNNNNNFTTGTNVIPDNTNYVCEPDTTYNWAQQQQYAALYQQQQETMHVRAVSSNKIPCEAAANMNYQQQPSLSLLGAQLTPEMMQQLMLSACTTTTETLNTNANKTMSENAMTSLLLQLQNHHMASNNVSETAAAQIQQLMSRQRQTALQELLYELVVVEAKRQILLIKRQRQRDQQSSFTTFMCILIQIVQVLPQNQRIGFVQSLFNGSVQL